MEEIVITVGGTHCNSCAILIDESVEELAGVRSSRTDIRRGETTIQFENTEVNVGAVIAAIESVGYTAEIRRGGGTEPH